MRVSIMPGKISGNIKAIPSKSHLHRLLILAALADKETKLNCADTDAEDIKATIDCLTALGAVVKRMDNGFVVTPINRKKMPRKCVLPCLESGSTLRFMLPLVCALGIQGEFHMAGRLPKRPLAPFDDELSRHGIRLWWPNTNVLCCEGQLASGDFILPGNVSSQYISGLLMALPELEEDSSVTVTGEVESSDYITMTKDAKALFKVSLTESNGKYAILGETRPRSPQIIDVEGDWSNAAFWLCAGAMPGGDVKLGGLNKNSSQGDREICGILEQMGAEVKWKDDILHVCARERHGIVIDAREVPDLVPVLAAVASVSEGTTIVKNAARLRLKESDRLNATTQTLNLLGAKVTEEASGLKIEGVKRLKGGTVDSFSDHRIAMMAAIASTACENPVVITNAQAVNKSYPTFWKELSANGKNVVEEEK